MAHDVLKAHRAQARGIPSSMPAQEVEVIPVFGRTWYTRGLNYWLRRMMLAFSLLITVVAATAIAYGVFTISGDFGNRKAALAWKLAVATILVANFVVPVRRFITEARRRRTGELLPPGPSTPIGWRGSGNWATRLVVVAAGPTAMVLVYGWLVLLLIWALAPEMPVEHDARLRLQQPARFNPKFKPDQEPRRPYHR